jgi:hypothetical protein
MTSKLIYIASPFSSADPSIEEDRFQAVCKCAAVLKRCGVHAFSPIAHGVPIFRSGGLSGDFACWEAFDRCILERCQHLLICCLPGWLDSKGIQGETAIAIELGMPVGYLFEPFNEDVIGHFVRKAGLV